MSHKLEVGGRRSLASYHPMAHQPLVIDKNVLSAVALLVGMVALVGHWTYDLQVAGSSPPGRVPIRNGLRQATYTCVPLSPSSIIWYRSRVDDLYGWESNLGPDGKYRHSTIRFMTKSPAG